MNKGLIFDFKRYAVHDGPGIRTTVFLKGCAATCWWCHNPESQEERIETITRKNIFDGNIFEEHETIGKEMTVDQVISEIEKDQIFYEESSGGVTFSGGEPLVQPDFLHELLIRCRELEIHTALDTSGYAPEDVFKLIMKKVNLFLFDLKFIDDNLHQKYTGVSNANILMNLKILAESENEVILRFPVIPGITDSSKNTDEILQFITELDSIIHTIDILPFHKIAKHKYSKLNKEYLMPNTPEPSEKSLIAIKSKFEHAGLKVSIGG